MSENLHGPFLRAVLPAKVEAGIWAMVVDRKTKMLIIIVDIVHWLKCMITVQKLALVVERMQSEFP